jgi:hypothetical protein
VMDISSLLAKAHIGQRQAQKLHVGDEMEITTPGVDAPGKGEVVLISPALDPGSTSVEVWVRVPNKGSELKAGTTVKVTMATKTIEDALVVPTAAIVTDSAGMKQVMLVATDGTAHHRNIELGITQDNETQVTKGLQEGERIVTSGAYAKEDGTKVKISAAEGQWSGRDRAHSGQRRREEIMSSDPTRFVPAGAGEPIPERTTFWLVRHTQTIFFFTIILGLAGIYLASQVPISVFPETNFPRVVIGIDNGVMPVEQMQVLITKPIEDAVNSVPGLTTVRSTTSRGTAEVSLFFGWNEDMVLTLQLVDAALPKVAQTLPSTAHITTNRLTFATFPILGYSLTSDSVSPPTYGKSRPTT